MLASWKKRYDQAKQHIKKQTLLCQRRYIYQSYGFSSSHVWMWEFDYKKSWASKNWCFWTVVLEKTLESPLDCKEIQPVNPKGNQSWIVIGRTDAEAPILWPPDVKDWLLREDPDAGKDWRWEEKGTTEDEMVGWHHRLNGHEFDQAQGIGDGKGSLACCSPWFCKKSDTTKQLNCTINQANPSTYMILWSLLDFVSQLAAKNQNKLCPGVCHILSEHKPLIWPRGKNIPSKRKLTAFQIMMITTAIAIVKNKIEGAKEEGVFPSYEALMESISILSWRGPSLNSMWIFLQLNFLPYCDEPSIIRKRKAHRMIWK